MYEQDYIMRLIHEIVRTLLKLLFNLDLAKETDFIFKDETLAQKQKLLRSLFDDGNIDQAENQLLDSLETDEQNGFMQALLFYEYLNEKDETFLTQHNFSREEISEGLLYAAKLCGYDAVAQLYDSLYS